MASKSKARNASHVTTLFRDRAPASVRLPFDVHKCKKLIAELLDSEHDLSRATGQINPLYLYVQFFLTHETHECLELLNRLLYDYTNRGKPLGPGKITANMSSLFEGINTETITTEKTNIIAISAGWIQFYNR